MAIVVDPTKDYTYSNFRDQNLAGTDWQGVSLVGSNFRNCIMSGGKFQGCDLRMVNFSLCNLNGTRFDENTKIGGSAWITRVPKNDNGKKAAKGIHPSISLADDTMPEFDQETGEMI